MSSGAFVRRSTSWSWRLAGLLAAGALLALVATAIVVKLPAASPLKLATLVGLFVIAWVFLTSPRTEVTLAVLMLYLGIADGYLKLKTNSSLTTLGRDVLLYAITIGMLVRAWLRREPMRLPPLSGWVLMWLALVLVQLFNPHDSSVAHSLASLRPHLEFVPLFFIAFTVMRSTSRLRWFLILFLLVANANAIAGVLQFGDSPAQLASWGPGYTAAVYGTGTVSGRVFVDSAGATLVRPFALGSDFGFGGTVGAMALPALVALLMLSENRRSRLLALCLAPGVFLAIVTSDSRTAVVSGFVSLVAVVALGTTGRNLMRALSGLAVAAVLGFVAISLFAGSNSSSEFSRYSSISPGQATTTAYNYRKGNFAQIPSYLVDFPFGDGIGSVGPAARHVGGPTTAGLDAEGEALFLLIEVGIPGAIVLLGFMIRLMWLSASRLRQVEDPRLRILLTGFAAPIFTLFASGFVGINSAGTPGSPFLWFSGGVLSYWLLTPAADRLDPGHRRIKLEPVVGAT